MLLKKKLIVGVLVASVCVTSFGFVQFLAPVGTTVMWLGRIAASNVVRARVFEWVVAAHGAAISYFWYQSSSAPDPAASTPVKAVTFISPSPASKRDNPDKKRYDDASSGRDPTPKASYAGEADQNYSAAPTAGAIAASMPSGSTWTVAVSNANSWTTYTSVAISTFSGTSDAQKCASAQSATTPASTGWAWTCPAGTSSDSKSVGLWYKTTTGKVCAAGYSLSSGNCVLQDASAVMKPAATLPCEVIKNANGSWEVDSKNPTCVDLQQKIITSGKKLSVDKGDGSYDEIQTSDDGGTTIKSGNRTIDLGPPDGDGNSPIRGITDSGSASSGSGTSNGSSGSSGSGTGSCGGTGQVKCSVLVDDTSFENKSSTVTTAADTVGAKRQEYQDSILAEANKSGETFGLSTSWIPSLVPGAPVSCSNLKWEPAVNHGPLSGLAGSLEIDWCSKLDVFREYYAWLVGMVTVIAIAMLFFGSNGGTGRSER